LGSKVPKGYKIKANLTGLETNGKRKTAEGSGLVCCYAERERMLIPDFSEIRTALTMKAVDSFEKSGIENLVSRRR